MKSRNKITVFLEDHMPEEVWVYRDTTVEEVLKLFKADKIECPYLAVSNNKFSPGNGISRKDTFMENLSWEDVNFHKRKPDFDPDRTVLWIGKPPKKNERKYDYRWVGRELKKITRSEASRKFERGAMYHPEYGMYSIQGIKARDTGELYDTWVKIKGYDVVED